MARPEPVARGRRVVVGPDSPPHPALVAWRDLGGTAARPVDVQELRRKPGRSWVVRLGNLGSSGDPPLSVVAKRIPVRIARRELSIYRDVLPASGVTAPRLLGSLVGEPPSDPGEVWLFLEDVGDLKCDTSEPATALVAAEWLVAFARGTAFLSPADVPGLPSRDPGHYRRFLDEALTARSRAGVGGRLDEGGLRALAQDLDRVEAAWPLLEEVAADLPPCVSHGDFLSKNLGLRVSATGERSLHPYDWDNAGWGFSGFDMAHLGLPFPGLPGQLEDLEAGYRGLRAVWPQLSRRALVRGAALARISWCLSVVAPTLAGLEDSYSASGAVADLTLYGQVLREAVRGLGL